LELIQKTRGGAIEAVKVFMELIKMVKISQISPKKSANSLLLTSFLDKIWKIFPHFSFVPEYFHSLIEPRFLTMMMKMVQLGMKN